MNYKKIFLGMIFIFLGIIIATNSLDITNINPFFKGWWTLFIIVPAILNLLDKNKYNKFNNITSLLIGIILLFLSRGIFSFNIIKVLIIPSFFIFLGLSIIFNNIIKNKISAKFKDFIDKDPETLVAIFSKQNISKKDEEIKYANLEAVFGNLNFDLTDAKLKKETFIKTSSVFGTIKMIVPDDVNIKIKSNSIFGEITNKNSNKKDNNKTIYIDSFCLFGGFEIK